MLREKAFLAAAAGPRKQAGTFDRNVILEQIAAETGATATEVDRGLFADLRSEQRLVKFDDFTVDQLLHRYNVALAQTLLCA